MKHIVCAYDGSLPSKRAAELGADFARQYGANLTLVYAVEPLPAGMEVPGTALIDLLGPYERGASDLLEQESGDLSKKFGVTASTEVRVGAAADVVLSVASDAKADMVVVGSRGNGAVKRLLLGSVADRIAHLSAVPVLVVH